MWDGTKIHEWILLQTDCWIEDYVCFHIGMLFQNYCEQHSDEVKQLTLINKRELERLIAVESHLAKHTVMNRRYNEQQRKEAGRESTS